MDAEIIIVGAGPAGSTCARLLAQRRRSVLLLDRARFPRDKPCGGWVNLKVFQDFPELEKLRAANAARRTFVDERFHGIVFHSPDLAREAAFTSRSATGYLVRRKEFDHFLLAQAAAAGARFLPRHDVTALDAGEQEVTLTAHNRRFTCQVVVAADGAESTVARLAGLTRGWPAERRINCAYQEIKLDPRTVTRLYGSQRRLHVSLGYGGLSGYAWAFPKHASVNLGLGCRADRPGDPKTLFAQWAADLERIGLLPAKCRLPAPVLSMVPAGGAIDYEGHVGKRVVLVGDAGGFVSAATGEGIYPAMLSARVAAECIDDALRAPRPQDALTEFKFAWRRRFAAYIQRPDANLAFLVPLIYDNPELCNRFARMYLFGETF